jgi:hypothetical protein
MTIHVPTQRAGYPDHHFLRFALVTIAVVAAAMILFIAALQVRPATDTGTSGGTTTQLVNEYRAGERALWALPPASQVLENQFRTEERGLWTLP